MKSYDEKQNKKSRSIYERNESKNQFKENVHFSIVKFNKQKIEICVWNSLLLN